MRIIKEYLLGYIIFAVAAGGYFGYFLEHKSSFVTIWAILAVIGMLLIFHKNGKRMFTHHKWLVLISDGLFLVIIPFIASIPSTGAMSILISAGIALAWGLVSIQSTFHPWYRHQG